MLFTYLVILLDILSDILIILWEREGEPSQIHLLIDAEILANLVVYI